MNVVDARGMGEENAVVIGGAMTLTATLAVAGPCQVGIRPEHVTLVGPSRGQGQGVVRVVEPLGAETLVHLDVGEARLVARVRGLKAPRAGDHVGVKIESARLHVFDAHGARLA